MIKTKSIYKPKEDSDGTRVLITRFYPRGVRKDHFDEWVRALAPSVELLKGYKEGKVDQEQFKTQFYSQIYSNTDSLEAIQTISKIARHSNVTLLCYEKDGDFCHRYLVNSLIMNEIKDSPMILS
ncbi:MAG: DUF488 domain-containing protein [Nitrosotalea sp.]